MNQFGVHMHFLQFKQVLTFIYALKIDFCDYFLFSQVSRSGPKFQKGQGPRRKKSQDTDYYTDCGLIHIFPEGSLVKWPSRRGVLKS
jgi:hypothetical protein